MTTQSHEIVERALESSRADGCVVIAGESSTVNLRWANNTLTTNGAARDRSVTVISVVGQAFGVRSASNVTDSEDLEKLLRLSEADAREAEDADDYAGLLGPGAGVGVPHSPGETAVAAAEAVAEATFTDPAQRTSTGVFTGFARELGEAFAAARADGQRLFGFAEHGLTTTWLGTSAGLRLRHSQPTGSVEWNAKSTTPAGSVWHGQSTHDFTDVSVPATHALLRERLAWSARSVELPAGRYETLLPPSAVADLLTYTYWSAAGRDAAEGRTVFSRAGGSTRIGETLGPAGLHLFSDPLDPELPATPFVIAGASSATSSVFDNGLPLRRTDWIVDGRLATLIHTRASARDATARGDGNGGKVAAAPFIDNLTLDGGGTASLDELIANTSRGLLLTCLWYIREVDPQLLLLTGLTRDGVYLVEDGEVVGAVNNFRFNESPVDLLGRLTEVGATVRTLPREWGDWFTLARMPALRVPDFNMSSVSPAS
ncbi:MULTISPECIES: metallopeptidase TldD-related protein [unclassified Frankia]|uniref:metallopeptidase TldD-related protein n=1 Tax=unclassified Frankia TaxID=2632575 RepID=UPI0020247B0F